MGQDHLIDELDFILTHPAVKPENLEGFYNQCLMAYPTVPLYKIVNHVYKSNRQLLADWSAVNRTIRHAVLGLGVELNNSDDGLSIQISKSDLNVSKDYFVYNYTSKLEFSQLRTLHQLGKIRIRCSDAKSLELVGIRKIHSGTYKLYLKGELTL
ncbi:hypothetical protein ACE41H_15410 [Paenibacillus enshidis]|uniref:Uncharacterized protein n=1 Tax=Paenibacillus enshidis TaxID=1458439 RepID=A0ABV5AVB1_9BACL